MCLLIYTCIEEQSFFSNRASFYVIFWIFDDFSQNVFYVLLWFMDFEPCRERNYSETVGADSLPQGIPICLFLRTSQPKIMFLFFNRQLALCVIFFHLAFPAPTASPLSSLPSTTGQPPAPVPRRPPATARQGRTGIGRDSLTRISFFFLLIFPGGGSTWWLD